MSLAPGILGRWTVEAVEVSAADDGRPLGLLLGAALARRTRTAVRVGDAGGCATLCVIEGRPCRALTRQRGAGDVVATFLRDGVRERMRGALHVFGEIATIASDPECGGSAIDDDAASG